MTIIPLILDVLSSLLVVPKAIEVNKPPIKPPIWAALSIEGSMKPRAKFKTITGTIWDNKTLPRYNL